MIQRIQSLLIYINSSATCAYPGNTVIVLQVQCFLLAFFLSQYRLISGRLGPFSFPFFGCVFDSLLIMDLVGPEV